MKMYLLLKICPCVIVQLPSSVILTTITSLVVTCELLTTPNFASFFPRDLTTGNQPHLTTENVDSLLSQPLHRL